MKDLAEFEHHMHTFVPATALIGEVNLLVGQLNRCRRILVAHEDALTEAAERLEAAGHAPPVDDTMSGHGDTSRAAARSARKRRRAAGELGSLGDSMRRGEARTENVDAIANALAALTTRLIGPIPKRSMPGWPSWRKP